MNKKVSLILLCVVVVLGLCGCGNNNATHERVELNDTNIYDYITVNLQGALTDYSYSSYSGVKFSGGISSSSSSYEFENVIIAGTRGWGQVEEENDKKLLKREQLRLELSLQDGIKKYGKDKEIIVFMHYPPITNTQIMKNETNEFIDILKKYNIKKCYYGHLHSVAIKEAVTGEYFGIDFELVSADGVDFKLVKVK